MNFFTDLLLKSYDKLLLGEIGVEPMHLATSDFNSSKDRALTGREQDLTLNIHYDKTEKSKAREYAL